MDPKKVKLALDDLEFEYRMAMKRYDLERAKILTAAMTRVRREVELELLRPTAVQPCR